ncbi:hypothetical protein RCH33_738 [Flavobacterium daejeonense]|nr:hypothetical protein RCH33_738 [Flavobacterium daejeonense]
MPAIIEIFLKKGTISKSVIPVFSLYCYLIFFFEKKNSGLILMVYEAFTCFIF